jgi:hypothetical protein
VFNVCIVLYIWWLPASWSVHRSAPLDQIRDDDDRPRRKRDVLTTPQYQIRLSPHKSSRKVGTAGAGRHTLTGTGRNWFSALAYASTCRFGADQGCNQIRLYLMRQPKGCKQSRTRNFTSTEGVAMRPRWSHLVGSGKAHDSEFRTNRSEFVTSPLQLAKSPISAVSISKHQKPLTLDALVHHRRQNRGKRMKPLQ